MSDVENLLVVGSGGREFALIDEALKSGVSHVYSTRGEDAVDFGIEGVINTGTGEDPKSIAGWSRIDDMDLVVIGPEKPLVKGIGELLREKGVAVFGPNSDGARFEEDKTFTHAFVEKYELPNPPNSQVFEPEQADAAKDMIRELGPDRVVTKRVGLEGGKGAHIYAEDMLEQAEAEVDAVAAKGEKLLIQGRLLGPEYSATFILDGEGGIVSTALSRDHKALFDGGKGPMTGGMGAFAPLSIDQASLGRREDIKEMGLRIAAGLKEEGIDYKGVIYAGLMAETEDPESGLRILEFNVRLGDPETQVILQSLGGMAIDYMAAAARGALEVDLSRLYSHSESGQVSLTVCEAAPGYSTGEVVTGLPVHLPPELPEDVSIQIAGAKMLGNICISTGGRVAYVTKTAGSLAEARSVYDYIGRENGGVYIGDDQQVIRTDIGLV